SRAGENRYSVATLQGIVLAEHVSVNELKDCFPELYEVVHGIAWAGAIDRRGPKKLFPTIDRANVCMFSYSLSQQFKSLINGTVHASPVGLRAPAGEP